MRKLQKDDICKHVKERYPEIDEQKFRAISISTALADQAVEQEDLGGEVNEEITAQMNRVIEDFKNIEMKTVSANITATVFVTLRDKYFIEREKFCQEYA